MKQLFSPAGYPRTQLNSDTIYLKTVSESIGQGFSPTRLISTSIPDQKARLLSASDQLFGGFQLHPWFSQCARETHRTGNIQRNILLLRLSFIIKGSNLGTARWKRHTGQDMRKPVELPSLLQVPHSTGTPTCSPTRKLSDSHPFVSLWRLHYISMSK